MRIVWHGHSCFEIEGDGVTVVIDPHDGKSLGIRPPSASANAVLITHCHNDHNSSKIIRGNHEDFVEKCGRFSCSGMEVQGFPVHHDREDGRRFGPNVMYRFETEGMSVCHCGDIGSRPGDDVIEMIRNVDFLMVPAGEVNTLDMDSLFKLIDEVSPRIVIPMHYHVCGLSLPLKNLDLFMERINGPIDYVGSETDISKDELPPSREYWIFSR